MGAIAGVTIFLGLPVGRLRRPVPRLKAALNAIAVGILVFLVWDILTHAWEPIDEALAEHVVGTAVVNGPVLGIGLAVGMGGLVAYDQVVARRRSAAPSRPAPALVGVAPGGAGKGTQPHRRRRCRGYRPWPSCR